MTLTTHAVFGAAVASLFPASPEGMALAFCVAFASHFALDAIPHWDYGIRSASVDPDKENAGIKTAMRYDKDLLLDAISIGGDALLGIALSLLLFSPSFSPFFLLVLLGAVGAILPDALQFVYIHFKHQPLVTLQRFHRWVHTDIRFKDSPRLGIATQVVFLLAVAAFIASRRFIW